MKTKGLGKAWNVSYACAGLYIHWSSSNHFFFQSIQSKLFQMFDFGPTENMKKYNQVRMLSILRNMVHMYVLSPQFCDFLHFPMCRSEVKSIGVGRFRILGRGGGGKV